MTMTTQDLKAAARAYYAAIDADKMVPMPAVCAESIMTHLPGVPPLDRAAFQQFGLAFYAAFPDLRHAVLEQVAEGDTVVNRLLMSGTHQGEFQGIPATGRAVEWTAVAIQHFADGQVATQFLLVDAAGLLQQLNAVPAAG